MPLRHAAHHLTTSLRCTRAQVNDLDTDIHEIAHVGGFPTYDLYPQHPGVPEIAVIGAANVGKSTLVNMLTGATHTWTCKPTHCQWGLATCVGSRTHAR